MSKGLITMLQLVAEKATWTWKFAAANGTAQSPPPAILRDKKVVELRVTVQAHNGTVMGVPSTVLQVRLFIPEGLATLHTAELPPPYK